MTYHFDPCHAMPYCALAVSSPAIPRMRQMCGVAAVLAVAVAVAVACVVCSVQVVVPCPSGPRLTSRRRPSKVRSGPLRHVARLSVGYHYPLDGRHTAPGSFLALLRMASAWRRTWAASFSHRVKFSLKPGGCLPLVALMHARRTSQLMTAHCTMTHSKVLCTGDVFVVGLMSERHAERARAQGV